VTVLRPRTAGGVLDASRGTNHSFLSIHHWGGTGAPCHPSVLHGLCSASPFATGGCSRCCCCNWWRWWCIRQTPQQSACRYSEGEQEAGRAAPAKAGPRNRCVAGQEGGPRLHRSKLRLILCLAHDKPPRCRRIRPAKLKGHVVLLVPAHARGRLELSLGKGCCGRR
jgi:hypothetical protein